MPHLVYNEVDWGLLAFFVGLFLTVGSAENAGLTHQLLGFGERFNLQHLGVFTFVTAILYPSKRAFSSCSAVALSLLSCAVAHRPAVAEGEWKFLNRPARSRRALLVLALFCLLNDRLSSVPGYHPACRPGHHGFILEP